MRKFDLSKQLGLAVGHIKIIAVYPQKEPRFGTFEARGRMECPDCGGLMYVDGHFATGEKLASGYTPQRGELVRNDVMSCKDCGSWQVS